MEVGTSYTELNNDGLSFEAELPLDKEGVSPHLDKHQDEKAD